MLEELKEPHLKSLENCLKSHVLRELGLKNLVIMLENLEYYRLKNHQR
jgi:hypothetical protein